MDFLRLLLSFWLDSWSGSLFLLDALMAWVSVRYRILLSLSSSLALLADWEADLLLGGSLILW